MAASRWRSRGVAMLLVVCSLTCPLVSEAQQTSITHDCTCKCCKPGECPTMKTYTLAVGSADQCTEKLCRSHFYECPDYGSHSDEGIVFASYHDCTCSCCKGDKCKTGELTEHTFHAEKLENCNPGKCASNFYSCPDPGSHSSESKVFATYHDCMCACCDKDSCPLMKNNMFYAGSLEKCSEDMCRSKFMSCPDKGSHNEGSKVVAYYSGVMPPPPMEAVPVGSQVVAPGDKKKMVIPTTAVIGVSSSAVIFCLALTGILAYRRIQRERGFVWMKFDDIQATQGQANGQANGKVEMNGNGKMNGHS